MTAIRHARTPSNAPLSVARRPAADRGDSLAPSFSRKRTPPQAVALLHRLTLARRALTGSERSRKFVFQMRGISAIAKCATINKSRKFLDSVGYMLVLINVNINRKMRAQNFIQSLASLRNALATIEFSRVGSVPVLLRSLFFIAGLLIAARNPAAASTENPATWPRWLEPGAQSFAFSSALAKAPGASGPAVIADPDATQSLLAWTEHSLRLIQKYQQNPQRAVRTLALVHAAVHDAFVLAARDSGSRLAGLAAAHRAVSLTLAYLYPYESVGWIEAKGLALAHASGDAQRIGPARLERELQIGEQVAGDAIRRALTDGSDRRTAAPPPLSSDPGRWRATPPLNIHIPQEPLAGEWRAWVRESGDIQPPPPAVYDSPEF